MTIKMSMKHILLSYILSLKNELFAFIFLCTTSPFFDRFDFDWRFWSRKILIAFDFKGHIYKTLLP